MSDSASLYGSVFAACPDEWEVVPLADAIDFREGPGILAKDFRESGVPLLRLRNIERPFVDLAGCNFLDPEMVESRWSHFRVAPGDLLVSTSGTLGRVSIASPLSAGSIPYTGIIRMRPARPDIDSGFIRYFLTSPLFQLQAEASAAGSVLRHFGPSHLREMSFPVPPLDEQRAIAGVLGALDDKIEQNLRTARALERLARAIFRAWFVDFEPVKAKADGATAFPGMPQPVFEVLPTRFTDSAIGLVPQGWEVGTLGDIALQQRESVQPAEIDPETPYIGLEHMPRRSITLTNWEHAGKVTSGKARFRTGQILFGKLRPYFHKVGIAPIDGVCSTDIVVIEPKDKFWRGVVLGYASSDEFVGHATACSTGTKMPRTNWRDMASYKIAIPPEAIAATFTGIDGPLLELLSAGIFESRKLAAMRDYLLPKLLSAQVRVEAARGD